MSTNLIETSQLQTLVAVARVKSFSRAASDLGVTQSAISQSVKNLETKIEVKLFKRSGKKVVLTSEGEKLYNLAQGFLGQMEDTLQEIQFDKDSMKGKVRIGTLTGLGKSWVAPELLDFSREHAELTVSVRMGFQEDLVRDFENFRLDILILPEDDLPSTGEKVLLAEEKITLVYPDGPNFNLHKDIGLDELVSYPTILFEQEDHLFLKWCRERDGRTPERPNVRYIVNSHGNMLQAVKEGLGLAVVPNHVFNRSYYRHHVKTLGDQMEVSNGNFYVVFHKDSRELTRIDKTIERLTGASNPFSVTVIDGPVE